MRVKEKKYSEFGSRLKSACIKAGIEQKQLATIIGVSSNTISTYVKGTQIPGGDKLIAISEALQISLDYLLTGKQPATVHSRTFAGTSYAGASFLGPEGEKPDRPVLLQEWDEAKEAILSEVSTRLDSLPDSTKTSLRGHLRLFKCKQLKT